MLLKSQEKISVREQLSASRPVLMLAAVNILLAVTALFKDIYLASYLGTTANSDAFSLAYFIPDMLGNTLIASAIGTSCIPVFVKYHRREDAKALFGIVAAVNCIVAAISGAVLLAAFLLRYPIIGAVGSGFSPATKILCVNLLVIILPTVILYPAAAIGTAVLQIKGIFIRSALAPVLFNLVFFFSVFFCSHRQLPISQGIYLISAGLLAAQVVTTAYTYCIIVIKSRHFALRAWIGAGLRNGRAAAARLREAYLALPTSFGYVLILLFTQSTLYVERYISSNFGAGSLSALNYAYRLAQFPVWVFAAAITTITFPKMSKKIEEKSDEAEKILKDSILAIFTLSLPIMIAIYILKVPIISILFQRGSFNARSVSLTSQLLTGYSLAILGQSVASVVIRYVMAIRRIRTAVYLYLLTTAVNIAADFTLVHFFGIGSVGFGSAAASTLCALLMLFIFGIHRSVGRDIVKFLLVCAANIVTAAICLALSGVWSICIVNLSTASKLAFMVLGALVCGGLYLFSVRKLKIL
jgi:Uncharacterized membrane protein, putative virulence factor